MAPSTQRAQATPLSSPCGDERAAEERYNDQDPAVVAADLAGRAGEYAATLAGLDGAGWQRTGVYPWPEPAVRTVEWIGQRTAHDLFDCRRLLA
ncbi:MAG TPA: hypothetical protein VMR00_21555 [Streptosporangiaceae bacterium]|jgi:hypothetical protein|nr:hypothetical protein [Streptosporangiaceae bacterium]